MFFYFHKITCKRRVVDISVLEVNICEMKENLKSVKAKLLFGQKICFVVKANGYGFGSKICKFFQDEVDYFAVSSGYEFFEIEKLTNKPIIILDPIFNEKLLKKLISKGAELTISNKESLQKILNIEGLIKGEIKIHLAINTGMNRFGISSISSFCEMLEKIKKSHKIRILGVFSHYFDGKCEKYSQNQLKKFIIYSNLLEKLLDKNIIKHISATDGIIHNNYGDMVRIGYGIYDNNYFDTIKLKTKILDFQILKSGESAGYNSIFVAKKYTKIAVVGIGYGDGILRNIAGKGYCLIRDKFAKILAVCMDSMLVDVTEIDCKINDDVIIIGKSEKNKISICDIASWCGTIGYEIIVRLSDRIKRVYLGDNKCKSLQESIVQEN